MSLVQSGGITSVVIMAKSSFKHEHPMGMSRVSFPCGLVLGGLGTVAWPSGLCVWSDEGFLNWGVVEGSCRWARHGLDVLGKSRGVDEVLNMSSAQLLCMSFI